jgi:hypothetical protein
LINNGGLSNVDNTSDLTKPISSATNSFRFKSTLNSPTLQEQFLESSAMVGLGNVDNTSDANKPVSNAQTALDLKANLATSTFTGTVSGIDKAMVGLGNVDNTSDANKLNATQTALDLKASIASLDLKRLKLTSHRNGNRCNFSDGWIRKCKQYKRCQQASFLTQLKQH